MPLMLPHREGARARRKPHPQSGDLPYWRLASMGRGLPLGRILFVQTHLVWGVTPENVVRPLLGHVRTKGISMLFRPFFILPFVLLSSAAYAQQLPPVIVTANRTPLPADHSGSSVSIITREELEKRGITQIYDALAFVPGMAVSRNGGIGGTSTVRLRGSSSGQVKVMVDGMVLNDPSNVDGSYDFNILNVNAIERIEVVRGPQSTLYGSDAMGGVINIITRKGEGMAERSAFVEGGSYNSFETGAGLYDSHNSWQYGVEARHFQTDGFSHSSAGNERDGTENAALNASLGYAISDTVQLDAQGSYSRIYSDFDPFTTLDGPAHLEKEIYTGQLKTEWHMREDWLQSLSLQAIQTDRSFDEPMGFYRYSTFDGNTVATEYQSTLQLSDNQTLVAGLRSENQSAKTTSTFGGITATDLDASTDNHAIFTEYLANLGENTALTLGGRYDHHEIFGSHVTERATLSHKLNEGATRLHASIGTGYKAPTLYQLYSAYGSASLNPEKSIGADAGVEQTFLDNHLRLSSTVFYNDFDDLIDFDPQSFLYTNIAKARSYGVENEALFDVTDAWLVKAGYTYLNAEDTHTGNVLPRRPKHSFTLGSAYTWPHEATLGFDLRYVSRQLDNAYSPDYTGAFTVINLYGDYPMSEKWEIYGRIDNLFDRNYQEALHFNSTGLAAYGGIRVHL